jgi:large subunit ribosomal protein L1
VLTGAVLPRSRQEGVWMNLTEAIEQLRSSEKRKFTQSFDLMINLANIDLKKPENKFSKDVALPHGRGKDVKVAVMSDSVSGAITKSDIEGMDKKTMKQLAREYEFFLAEAPLMPVVGKIMGRYLGPKGKMPKLLLPGRSPDSAINEAKKSVRVKIRDLPVVHVYVGSENMENKQIEENAMHIINEVKKSLPAKARIRNVYIKLTMSKPVKIDTTF